ncbi:MAG: hypothetical protein GC162_12260 [Planctomycetes bacterium]|nr:hypothetical protein [Planctomycetota bacterium]
MFPAARPAALFACLALSLVACQSKSEWEVTLENKSSQPCSVNVTFAPSPGSSSNARIDDLPPGQTVSLIVGNADTLVHTIELKQGDATKLLTPDTKLPTGKRYAITLTPEGEIDVSISDR